MNFVVFLAWNPIGLQNKDKTGNPLHQKKLKVSFQTKI
jgi:hypothetical protein